jgi:8-oxo-dGTP diphosphatase
MAEPISREYPERPFTAALAVCRRGEKVLIAERYKAGSSFSGKWGFPGGMQEVGETILAAAARELLEETGIVAEPLRVIDAFDVIGKEADGRVRAHFCLVCVVLAWRSGDGQPLEDASAVGCYTPEEAVQRLELFPDTLRLMKAALAV